ncbi:type 2 lanthipeptide synthetase LanM family protein [Pseudonocardia cypriaca]|uniref:type 2 lanthipeptide synthetase LanM family protein n=1 Tax=Pseudonocardia cypriaca TaxID=882449 RepID=UPI0014774436|nr:type 2 lanthipeptide synthetase LanM family protein [Pseudonocardia cypriaca]
MRDRLRHRTRWAVDPARADQQWRRWHAAPWFREGLSEWLAVREIPEAAFREALGAVAPGLGATVGRPEHRRALHDDDPDDTPTWFLKPIARAHVHDLLAAGARDWRSAPWWPGSEVDRLESELTRELAERLRRIAIRCLVTEVNARRLREDFTSAEPRSRAREFAADLATTDRFDDLLADYPVLDALWRHEARRWSREIRTLFARLDHDHPALATVTGSAAVGRLLSITGPLGDPHRGGQSVRSLRFSDGSAVVYKPRPLTGEQWYSALAAALDRIEGSPGIRAPRVLARDGWGWQERIEPSAVGDASELATFYRRTGWIIAVAHVFSMIDLHAENLVAAGAHPVLVDLETTAHPVLTTPALDGTAEADETNAEHSVLLSMLLPTPQWTDGLDLSAISGGAAGTITTTSVIGLDTDAPRLAARSAPLPAWDNRPRTAEGTTVDPVDHLDEVLAGFRDAYRGILRRKDELLAADGALLGQLRAGPLRYIVRPTRVYAQALEQSTHPGLMTDAAERELYLSHLWGRRHSGPHRRLVSSEVEDLLDLDIPVFSFRLDDRSLTDSRGRVHADFFPRTPSEMLESHIAALSEQDLRAQEWAVEAALRTAGSRPRPTRPASPGGRPPAGSATAPPTERIVESALGWLHEHQIRTSRGPIWFGMRNSGELRVPDLVGETLYDGRIGIALFLAAAARYTGDRRARADAGSIAGAVVDALAATDEEGLRRVPPSAWEGLSGIAWGLVATLDLLETEPPREVLARCARVLAAPAKPDEFFDVISGSAGIALCATALAERGYREFEEVAGLAGRRLLFGMRADGNGVSWPVGKHPELGMTGFAHGNAGVAAALGRLHAYFGDDAYRQAAARAIAWEDDHFDVALGGWHDLRHGVVGPPEMVAWCHGAPGIVLGHAIATGAIGHAHRQLLLDTVTGCETSHVGLCHGGLGNIESLTVAAADDPAVRNHALACLDVVAERILDQGAGGDEHSRMPTPALMTGVAGLGYGILRIQHGRDLPSPLVMELCRR